MMSTTGMDTDAEAPMIEDEVIDVTNGATAAAPVVLSLTNISKRFGPVQATAFGDLPEVSMLQQIQGAAEPGAIDDGHLAAAVEWMRAREVDYRIPVAGGRPGADEAEADEHAARALDERLARELLVQQFGHGYFPPFAITAAAFWIAVRIRG